MIRFCVLGTPTLAGAPLGHIENLCGQPKRLALLSYLAVARYHPVPRAELILLFWPERPEKKGSAALRQALHFLRANLGEQAIVASGANSVALVRKHFWCDAIEFENKLAVDDAGALSLYRGDFLRGVVVQDAPDFDHWLEIQRERFRTAAAFSAASTAELEIARGNYQAAMTWTNRGEMAAPTSERLARLTMILHDKQGDQAAAIEKFEKFSDWLRNEHGLKPSSEMITLVREIKRRKEASAAKKNGGEDGDNFNDLKPQPGSLEQNGGFKPADVETQGVDYYSLVEGASDIIYEVALDGTLLFANAAVKNVLGFAPMEIQGKHLFELVRDDYRDSTIDFYLAQRDQRMRSSYLEAPLLAKDGTTVWMGNRLTMKFSGGRLAGWHGIARDVTGRRASEGFRAQIALKDRVTGLHSVDAFKIVARNRMLLGGEVGLTVRFLTVTLKNFEEIDRSFGYREVQRALIVTSQLLLESFSGADFVARIGRNRFGIVTSGLDCVSDDRAWGKLESRLAERSGRGDLPFTIELSYGLLSGQDPFFS